MASKIVSANRLALILSLALGALSCGGELPDENTVSLQRDDVISCLSGAARDANLVPLPVDHPIQALVAAAAMTRGDSAVVVAPGGLLERFGEGLLGFFLGDLLERGDRHPATAW